MNPTSSRGQTLPGIALSLGAVAVVVIAFALLVNRPAAPPSPSGGLPAASPAVGTPVPTVSARPSTAPSVAPSVGPSDPVFGDMLESATGQDVRLVVGDQT